MTSHIKYKILCTPTFLDAAFIANQRSPAICCNWWYPTPFVFKCAPPIWNQCKFCQCYAMATALRCGMTLIVLLYHGSTLRDLHKTHPWSSSKFVINHEQHLKEWWIHPSLYSHDQLNNHKSWPKPVGSENINVGTKMVGCTNHLLAIDD